MGWSFFSAALRLETCFRAFWHEGTEVRHSSFQKIVPATKLWDVSRPMGS